MVDRITPATNYQLPTTQPPLVVVVGETASGKSALAIELAQKFEGEIICADSRTIYKGMDIGTAKPSQSDRGKARHHLLDIVKPDQKYNVAMFKQDALNAIDDISKRGKIPIMVGGTGLYVDSVIFDYNFDNKTMGKLRANTLVVGIKTNRDELDRRIEARVDSMIKSGFANEVKKIGERYGWDSEAMTGIGYGAFSKYLQDELTLEGARQKTIRDTKQFAKRQRTWFKRNKSIQWVNNSSNAVDIVTTFLDNL